METFCVDTFMKRVDSAKSAAELADLQLELAVYSQSLGKAERRALVEEYMNRLKARTRQIRAASSATEILTTAN
jgi:hypothetical protein